MNESYNSKDADYILRDTISTLKSLVDMWYLGFLDDENEDTLHEHLGKIKQITDNLYELLNNSILEKAKKIHKLAKELDKSNKRLERRNKLFEQELIFAREIQHALIPETVPETDMLDIISIYKPMDKVGGDFFEFITTRENVIGVLICDVSGHGVPAAFITTMIKVACTMFRRYANSPSQFIENLNKYLLKKTANNFITVSYNIFDSLNKKFIYSNGGHPYPLLYRKQTDELMELKAHGTIVGMMDNIKFEEVEIDLLSGDRIIFYTDGLIETLNDAGIMFGETSLHNYIMANKRKNLNDFSNGIIEILDNFRENQEYEDDIAFIAVEVK